MKLDLKKDFEANKAKTYFNTLLNKQSNIELKEIKNKRSVKHNAYLHVCITLFAIEFGYTLQEAKTLLKRECEFMRYKKNKTVFLKETKKMLSDELSKFIEWIRNYSSSKGCYIPSSDEYITNRFDIDKEIDKHKEYL